MKTARSKVVLVRGSASVVARRDVSPDTLQRMLEVGLLALTECNDPVEAWLRFFSPRDTVGIKVNCLGGRNMCTRPALAAGAAAGLRAAGLPAHQVIVWDRSSQELDRCKFPVNRSRNGQFLCLGTDEKDVGYEEDLTIHGSIGSRFSKLVTRRCSAMLNMPVLKDHGLCGLTAALKNTFGTLHNPNKYHEDRCNPFVADANTVPFIRGKNRLVVCDALTVQYKGGPSYHPQWASPLGMILLAEDPVALDRVGFDILNRLRAEHGLPPVEEGAKLPSYITTAADPDHHLGRCVAEEIEIVERAFRG